MRRYREVLRVPHVAALVGWMMVSRLPLGINGLAVILFLRAETGSFAVAGAVAGGLAVGGAAGAQLVGRLVDSHGVRVLVLCAVLHAVALGALVAGGMAGAPAGALVAVGVVAGGSVPPSSSVLRSLWPSLLGDRFDLRQAAYAIDSVGVELLFTLGPLLTALLATLVAPAAALAVSGVAVLVGTLAFVAQPGVDAGRTPPREGAGRLAGALRSPGVLTLALTSVPAGVGLGIVEVSLPAFSAAHGAANRSGLLLAVWSIASAVGGILYGALPRPPLERAHLAVSFLLPISLLPLAAATSLTTMALLVIPAGIFIAPMLATRNELIGRVAPEDARTEAFTWPQTGFVSGIAIGSALAGAIVQQAGPATAFLAAGGLAAFGAVIAVARRSTVAPRRSYPV
jgi:MFS family permease